MSISTDFEVQLDKDIRYIGAAHGASGAGYYSVIEFHRWLQDLADDASSTGDDFVDITRETPSDRSTDNIITLLNGYNIDDTTAEHLYGGSIIQASGATIYDGLKVFANPGMSMKIIQNNTVISNDFWNSIPFGTGLIGLNPDSNNGISHRFLVKVRTGGADINGRRLICQTRVWGKTYSEFKINGTSRGENVAALTYADDLNNTTSIGTIAALTTITNTLEGYNGIDIDNNGSNEFYYSKWDLAGQSVNDFYQRIKWLQRQGSASTMYGLNGELFRGITHEITLDGPTGTFAAFEAVSWATGTGQMLAINSTTAPTKMWIQLLTGVAPVDNQVITGASTATATVNVTVLERTLSFPAAGVSTGSAIIGSYGLGIEQTDISYTDKLFDLTNAQVSPPNIVTFTVSNLVAGDYVFVAPSSVGAIDTTQMTLNGALTGAAVTSVVVSGSIPSDTPTTGTIRILRANGFYTRHPYTARSGSTFTITAHNFSTNNASNGAGVYVSYIDGSASGSTMTFSCVYSTDRSLYVRVRNGGGTPKIKTYETVATLGSAGGSASTSRISDE